MSRNNVKRPLIEQIEELKVKIDLLDGDRKAYYESSFFVMQKNKEAIAELRKETNDIRRQLRDRINADDHVINQAFQNRPVEKAAFSHKTSVVAIEQMDYKVSDTMKRYNQIRNITENKRKTLDNLQQQITDLQAEVSTGIASRSKDSKTSQALRDMENRLDKLKMKSNEADYIHRTYQQIHNRLTEELMRCNHVLNDMEADIRRCTKEKSELVVMHKDAMSNQESTIEELRRHEEYIYADKKRREIELTRMRKVAEDKKLENERVEKKTVDDVLDEAHDDSTSITSGKAGLNDEVMGQLHFEEHFKKIKEATGTPDINGILRKFESQLEVKQKLITLINEMEDAINKLRQERGLLQHQLQEVKTNADTKLTDANKVIEEKKVALSVKNSTVSSTATEYENISKFIVQAKAGLEHMMEKLMHFKSKEKLPSIKIITAEDYIMDVIRRIEGHFNRMLSDLTSFDLDDYKTKMLFEEDVLIIPTTEFQASIKKRVPANNARVKSVHNRERGADDDDDSGEDLPEWKSRTQMKIASDEFIQLKKKKKQQRRKKKGK